MSPPGSFDSVEYLRSQYEERLGPQAAAELPIPFEIGDSMLAAAEGRISPAAGERDRVEQVTDFIFGWLGLDYSLTPTRSAMGTFRAREGNCLSFVNLFVGLAREHRLAPFYVEVEDYQRWDYNEGSVVSHGHIVAGMRVDGKLETFDFLPYRPKSYRDFEPIDDLKAAAHYFNNLGAEALMQGDLERARQLTEIAVGLTPWFDKAVNNLGVTLLRQGEAQEALAVFENGLERDPEDVALLTNAARAHQQLGHPDEAEELLARLDDVHHSNPFFYVYRGELALARGDLETALDYMRQAFRRDDEVPEVHVGLVKVYLAMGERRKALHHVERALQLDATHEQARSFATMLLGPTQGRR
ncbi:MAG: tetratricopeptide repeat protein [Thermoanaerobaculia bacterium]